MIVLVCGGRHFHNRDLVFRTLDSIHEKTPVVKIVQGGATGADADAQTWAFLKNVECVTYKPDWTHGRKAGPIRNQVMLEKERPDLVIAFPGGAGTLDMVSRAASAEIRTIEISR